MTVVEPVTMTEPGSAPTSGATRFPSSSARKNHGGDASCPPLDTEVAPLGQGAQDGRFGIATEQAERVTIQVNAPLQQVEPIAECPQWVCRIAPRRLFLKGTTSGHDPV